MITQNYQLYIERTDHAKNMAQFYAMTIEPCLFGGASLTGRWGRIGARGQSKTHYFDREVEAVSFFLDLVRQKRARRYRSSSAISIR